jgi:predicted nucleic acid-binding protein
VLRHAVLRRKLDERRAVLALEDLADWQIDRISHIGLIQPACSHRHNMSAYDAFGF